MRTWERWAHYLGAKMTSSLLVQATTLGASCNFFFLLDDHLATTNLPLLCSFPCWSPSTLLRSFLHPGAMIIAKTQRGKHMRSSRGLRRTGTWVSTLDPRSRLEKASLSLPYWMHTYSLAFRTCVCPLPASSPNRRIPLVVARDALDVLGAMRESILNGT